LLKATVKSTIGASSLLWLGDVFGGDMPVRPMTSATIVYHGGNGLQTSVFLMIDDLAPSPLVLVRSVPVIVYKEDGVHVASFVDANINASGETAADAVEMLKEMIASTYRLLRREEPALGTQPKNQLAVLRRFVRK